VWLLPEYCLIYCLKVAKWHLFLAHKSLGCNSNATYQYKCEEEVENGGFPYTLRRDNIVQLAVTDTIRDDNEEIRPAFIYPAGNPCTILQMISIGRKVLLLQISTSLSTLKERLQKDVELLGLKNIRERSSKLLLTDLHSAALIDKWLDQVCYSRVVQNVYEFFTSCLQYKQKRRSKLPNHLSSLGGQKETCGHIHVIHDCNRNHGNCRCAFLLGYANIRFAKGTVWRVNWKRDVRELIFQQGRATNNACIH